MGVKNNLIIELVALSVFCQPFCVFNLEIISNLSVFIMNIIEILGFWVLLVPEEFFISGLMFLLLVLVFQTHVLSSLTQVALVLRGYRSLVLVYVFLLGVLFFLFVDEAVFFKQWWFEVTPGSYFFRFLIAVVTFIILPSVYESIRVFTYEWIIIYGFLVFGLFCLLISNDLVITLLLIDLVALATYILIASWRDKSGYTAEAALKYFILGSFVSGILWYSLALFFADMYTFQFVNILVLSYTTGPGLITVISVVLFFSGLLFKLAAAPVHHWAVDVYDGSCRPLMLLQLVVIKFVLFVVLMRLVYVFSFFHLAIEVLFWISGIASVMIGAFGALLQCRLKRFLTYSSIHHMGFLLLGINFVETIVAKSFSASMFYISVYLITTLALLLFISFVFLDGRKLFYLTDLTQIKHFIIMFGALFCALLFSSAGLPPFVGFWAKWQIIVVLMFDHKWLTLITIMIGSLTAIFNYLRLIKIVCFTVTKAGVITMFSVLHIFVLSFLVCASLILGYSIAPNGLLTMTNKLIYDLIPVLLPIDSRGTLQTIILYVKN